MLLLCDPCHSLLFALFSPHLLLSPVSHPQLVKGRLYLAPECSQSLLDCLSVWSDTQALLCFPVSEKILNTVAFVRTCFCTSFISFFPSLEYQENKDDISVSFYILWLELISTFTLFQKSAESFQFVFPDIF